MRVAVVRSGLRSDSFRLFRPASLKPGSRRGHAARHAGGVALGGEAADGHGTLRQRIDLAVGAEQGGDQKGAALEILGVAHRRHRYVDAGARRGKGRQRGGHHHGGDVLGLHDLAAGVGAQPLQHGLDALLGERGVLQAVAGAVQADHQAIADQHVVADALHLDQVLDPAEGQGRGRKRGQEAPDQEGGDTDIRMCAAHDRLLPLVRAGLCQFRAVWPPKLSFIFQWLEQCSGRRRAGPGKPFRVQAAAPPWPISSDRKAAAMATAPATTKACR